MSNQQQTRRNLAWAQVDVFAESPYEGNMLAVFEDARGLTTTQMQALARETNLSESVFLFPGDSPLYPSQDLSRQDPAGERNPGIRARIFTTEEELPFAGHPTLGAASWIRTSWQAYQDAAEVRLHLDVGTISVRFNDTLPGPGIYGEMRQRDPEFGSTVPRARIAPAIGLTLQEMHDTLEPQVVSTGLPILIVPLRSVAAARKLQITPTALTPLLTSSGAKFAFCIAPVRDTDRFAGNSSIAFPDADFHARMQFYGGEDPATGSASGCAIAYLVRHGAAASDVSTVIEQGIEVRRPSRILARASLRDGEVRSVIVGGRTIPVASGRFILP